MLMRYINDDGEEKTMRNIKEIEFIGNRQLEVTLKNGSIRTLDDVDVVTILERVIG